MRVATPGGQRVPWVSNFCETNVRTYVRDQAGRSGIWFFSLDAARLGAVVAARITPYRLPYFWSQMRLGDTRQRDRLPVPPPLAGPRPGNQPSAASASGSRSRPPTSTTADHFLTARWVLFSVTGRRAVSARAWHQPWPLHRAQALVLDDHLVTAAGLPTPEGEPLVHYSPGVDVAIGRPEA